jgi:hypothetical protein
LKWVKNLQLTEERSTGGARRRNGRRCGRHCGEERARNETLKRKKWEIENGSVWSVDEIDL